jgi:hypothetical protein
MRTEEATVPKVTYYAPEGTIVHLFDENGSPEKVTFGKAACVTTENPLHQDALARSPEVLLRKPSTKEN